MFEISCKGYRMKIIVFLFISLLLILPVVVSGNQSDAKDERIREASGIARVGESVLIVGDDIPGTYFKVPISSIQGVLTEIKPGMFNRFELFGGEKTTDLEGIEVMADGRIVAISEDRCELYSKDGIVARYPASFIETGNRGLEGLAIREGNSGSSVIAVLWEGGFPIAKLLEDRHKHLNSISMPIVVFLHTLAKDAVDLNPEGKLIVLDNPLPPGVKSNEERFRAPGIVWHRFETGGEEQWGLIVLMRSLNAESSKFSYHYLHLYDLEGNVIAKHDLGGIFKKYDVLDQNWEGLDWFVGGESLLMVNDNYSGDNPIVMVIDLPEDWKTRLDR